jgi:hypothetical protein
MRPLLNVVASRSLKALPEASMKRDGWIIKVLEECKTIGGTCWYQLNPCSICRGSKKSHAVTWFGVCSYRKRKLVNGDARDIGLISTFVIANKKQQKLLNNLPYIKISDYG